MIKIEEVQERLARSPDRTDVKACLRESSSVARGGNALSSIRFLLLAIFGILKIRDLTKPEKQNFNENISKILGGIDLIPIVKEATRNESSLTNTFEDKGLKETFARLQKVTKEIKKLEQKATESKALKKREEIQKAILAITKEIEKGNIAAAKNKADRLLEMHPKNKTSSLDRIIEIFEKNESIKGWWYYLQKRYDPAKCTLEEARFCAAQVAKIRSLDDPKNSKDWYRNNLDYRLKVWELTPKEDQAEIDAVIEACYNLAICVYYSIEKIYDKTPKAYGKEIIEEGLKIAPNSTHLIKMGRTFGVRV